MWVLCACLSGGVLLGQTNPDANSSESSSQPAPKRTKFKEESFVRRFSIGITGSVMGLAPIRKKSDDVTTNVNTATTLEVAHITTGKSERIGYGLTGQVAISDHFAINVAAIMRKAGYTLDTTETTTTTKGLSITSTTIKSHEDTRVRFYDFPITLRYYNINRHDPGPRVFVEAGGAIRKVSHITTATNNTAADGTLTCCTVNPSPTAHSTAKGLVGGFGVFLIDPVGIRVIPEIRYTRWMNDIFNAATTRSQRNQIEAIISFSF